MKHDWQYLEEGHRKCRHCFIEEIFWDDDGIWSWIYSEDFMNNDKTACDGDED